VRLRTTLAPQLAPSASPASRTVLAEGEYDAANGRARIRLLIRTVPVVGADRNGRAGRHARRTVAAKRRASLGGHRLASVSSAAVVAPHHGAKAEAQAWVLLGEVSEHGMDGNAMLERASATPSASAQPRRGVDWGRGPQQPDPLRAAFPSYHLDFRLPRAG
jgi:hypothetical protein